MKLKTLSFFLLLCVITQAQSISGLVVDSSQAPVPFATVALMHASDSSIVRGLITDEKGAFEFSPVKNGSYFLRVQANGFEERNTGVLFPDSTMAKHPVLVRLTPAAKTLDEVTIGGMQSTVMFKNGNIIVNVENSALAKGNTVYELLSKLPGVSIENNSITMQGKTGVLVLIDGRLQRMSNEQLLTLLKGMSAENVQRIELLKNPPVKYDAAGTSGMINIVTKRAEQVGFSGNVYAETSQGIYNNASYGLALNYKNEKLSVFTGIDGVYNTYITGEHFDRNFSTNAGNTEIDNHISYKDLETGETFKLGADWYANAKNTLGFRIDGGPGTYTSRGTALNQFSGYNNNGFDHLTSASYTPNKWNILNYNLNAEHKFDTTGTVLDFSTDFTELDEKDKGYIDNYFYDANENEVLQPNIFRNSNQSATKIFSSKLDFTKTADSATTLEAGIKGSLVDAGNNYLFERLAPASGNFYTDPALSNNYIYREQTLAAYVNYSRALGHFNFQLGLRAENTNVRGKNITSGFTLKSNYFNLFPNLSVDYPKSKNHDFQLNLSRRIDRPGYDQLNPFVIYRDQYSYFQGNPFLQPDYSYTAELTWSYKGDINNSLSCSRTTDFMLNYTTQNDSTKIFIESSKNISFGDAYAYTLFIKCDPKSWWELSLNGNLSYLAFKGDVAGVPFHTHSFRYSANFTNSFMLPAKLKMEMTAVYSGPSVYGIISIAPRFGVSLAFKRSFFKGQLDASLGMSDIFKSMKFHSSGNFDNQDWNYYQLNDTRRLNASVSWNFGKVHAQEREMNSNESEKERLGK